MGMFPGGREVGRSAAGGVVQARAGLAESRHGRQHGAGVQLGAGVCAPTWALGWGWCWAHRLRWQPGLQCELCLLPQVGCN